MRAFNIYIIWFVSLKWLAFLEQTKSKKNIWQIISNWLEIINQIKNTIFGDFMIRRGFLFYITAFSYSFYILIISLFAYYIDFVVPSLLLLISEPQPTSCFPVTFTSKRNEEKVSLFLSLQWFRRSNIKNPFAYFLQNPFSFFRHSKNILLVSAFWNNGAKKKKVV